MKGLIVLACTLAAAVSSPTLGLLTGHGGHCGGGLPGLGHGGGHHLGIPGIPGVGGVIGTVGNIEKTKVGIIKSIAGKVLPGGGPLKGIDVIADKGYRGRGKVYPVYGGGFGQGWAFLLRGITDVAGNAGSILSDLLNFRIPGALDDILNGGISVARACGGIINAFFPGLGTLLGNFVVSFGKIFICVLGSPGISGAVLGDRRPGRDNPVDIPYICRRDWGKKYGWNYDGDYKINLVMDHYKVRNARKQCLSLINRYTKGRGMDAFSRSQRIVIERVLIIADILDRDSSTWTTKDMDTLNINLAIIFGTLGNSHQSGLGPILVREWLRYWKHSKGYKRGATDLSRYKDEILRGIQDAKEDKWSGAFDDKKRSDWDQIRKATEEENSADTTSNDDQRSNSNSSDDNNDSNSSNNKRNKSDSSEENNDSNSSNNKRNKSDSSEETNDSNSSNNKRNKSDSSEETNDSNSSNNKRNKSDFSEETNDSNSSNNKRNKSDSSEETNDSNSSNNKRNKSDSSEENNDSNSSNNKRNKSDSSEETNDSNSSNNKRNKSDSSEETNDSNSSNNKRNKSDSSEETNDSNSSNNKRNKSDSSEETNDSNSSNNKRNKSDSSEETNDSNSSNNKRNKSDSSEESNDSNSSNNKRNKSGSSDDSNDSNSNNKRNDNSNSPGGNDSTDSDSQFSDDASYKRHDKSLIIDKASEEKNRTSSKSGSGKKTLNADGSRVEEYNYQDSMAESSHRASERTNAQEHIEQKTSSDDF